MTEDFLETVRELYAREINVGLQTFFDAGVTVWIGDFLKGTHIQREFTLGEFGEAAAWLRVEADRFVDAQRAAADNG